MKTYLTIAASVLVLGLSSQAFAGGDNDDANDNDYNNQSIIGQDNDYNYINTTEISVDDITFDASTRLATSNAVLAGAVANNGVDNSSNAGAHCGAIAKAYGNEISIGGNGVTNNNASGISAVSVSSGANNLNQAAVQVSAQASFSN
jgi:hypothetical protein